MTVPSTAQTTLTPIVNNAADPDPYRTAAETIVSIIKNIDTSKKTPNEDYTNIANAIKNAFLAMNEDLTNITFIMDNAIKKASPHMKSNLYILPNIIETTTTSAIIAEEYNLNKTAQLISKTIIEIATEEANTTSPKKNADIMRIATEEAKINNILSHLCYACITPTANFTPTIAPTAST
ncbi:MAG: hypothetical protein KAJ86_00180 [Alphaproteobacteria bacterium]|nr:hypothetical protein [Alphaproteobacteria bacterium]